MRSVQPFEMRVRPDEASQRAMEATIDLEDFATYEGPRNSGTMMPFTRHRVLGVAGRNVAQPGQACFSSTKQNSSVNTPLSPTGRIAKSGTRSGKKRKSPRKAARSHTW